MKQQLVVRVGKQFRAFDLHDLVSIVGVELKLSKTEMKRLIKDGAVDVLIREI